MKFCSFYYSYKKYSHPTYLQDELIPSQRAQLLDNSGSVAKSTIQNIPNQDSYLSTSLLLSCCPPSPAERLSNRSCSQWGELLRLVAIPVTRAQHSINGEDPHFARGQKNPASPSALFPSDYKILIFGRKMKVKVNTKPKNIPKNNREKEKKDSTKSSSAAMTLVQDSKGNKFEHLKRKLNVTCNSKENSTYHSTKMPLSAPSCGQGFHLSLGNVL
ncbi:hypothetical protein C0J52_26563 [Blattella germanica]|nr:hypothetical protein C0J52_26563 [Blattella germanica]